jgi:hypothetical protein
MATLYLTVSYLSGVGAIVHAATRPESEWVRADRSKASWLTILGVGTLFALGIVVALVYAIGIVPLLASKESSSRSSSSEFEKR